MFIEDNKWRWLVVAGAVLLSLWWMAPQFIDHKAWWLSKEKLVYGLDIQGGLHLVLGVNVDDVLEQKLDRSKNAIVEFLNEEKVVVEEHSLKNHIFIKLKDAGQISQAVQKVEDQYGSLFQVLDSSDGQLELAYSQLQEENIRKEIIDQSIEVIRNRIDEFGVTEPVITAQGGKRILVQLPGIKEAERARELIQKTAYLELSLVSEELSVEKLSEMITQAEDEGKYSLQSEKSYRSYVQRLNRDLKSKLPARTAIAFIKDESARTLSVGRSPMLLETDTGLTGDMLEDASVGVGQFGEPLVNFRFGLEGRKIFSAVTSENIGRRIAVVLDGVVKTAPEIKDHLTDRGQITLGSGDRTKMLEEAQMVSTTLRAGALPTSLEQLEERTVGPTLGRDYVAKGRLSALVAICLVLIFLLVYYRWLGLVADIALSLNIMFLISFLASFGATLTLPGIAGIILTVGMAVDANIIIFERLKEELKKGSSVKLAINEGFGRAFSAILDANITTAIVCLILMYFGTGPIRGFAVTLFFGIITSVFTAIFVSRTILNSLILHFKLKL